jgi:acetyl-CoA acetyltransferase
VANAAAAVHAGLARHVVVYRSLAQGQFARFGQGAAIPAISGPMAYSVPYGIMSPAQTIALRTRRFMHEHAITEDALAAVALAAYAHAQRNPRAVMFGRPLTREQYDAARYIAEPFRLYDCCLENDGAAAVIVTSAERAADLAPRPAFILAAVQGSTGGHDLFTHSSDPYATANFLDVAPRLYQMAGVSPKDVDVAQIYENFTGAVVMSMVEHGLCAADEVMEVCTPDNLTGPGGRLPINTSGGNLAECYMHGLELVIEAVRQMRGESTTQIPGAEIALVAGGPVAAPVSSLLLGRSR